MGMPALLPNLGTRLPDGLDRTFLQARDTQAATTVLALAFALRIYKHHLLLAGSSGARSRRCRRSVVLRRIAALEGDTVRHASRAFEESARVVAARACS